MKTSLPDIPKTILDPRALKAARALLVMHQHDFAKLAGVHSTTMAKIEAGDPSVLARTSDGIALALRKLGIAFEFREKAFVITLYKLKDGKREDITPVA